MKTRRTRIRIREAETEEFLTVMRLLEGALLETDPESVREAIDDGDVLVADTDGKTDDHAHVRGALVLDGSYVEAVAVHRRHRRAGIGSALIRAAADRQGSLTAEFDRELRPFYESLGFEIDCGHRCCGRLNGPR